LRLKNREILLTLETKQFLLVSINFELRKGLFTMSNTKSPTTKPNTTAANSSKANINNPSKNLAKPALSSVTAKSNTKSNTGSAAKGSATDAGVASAPYRVGDEISFASPHGMLYGTIRRVIADADAVAVEIEFEDGHREIKKARDRALGLLRRASGKSEVQERQEGQGRRMLRDYDVDEVRRLEQRRGSRR
jgi:hypothetical protein